MKRSIFIFILFALFPSAASAATLTLGGPTSAAVGGTFNVPVLLSTAAGESANAVSGTITYPAALLNLVAVSKAGSIITLWPSDPTQSSGSAHFEGVILNPGWSGTGGTVVTLTFQALAAGSAPVAFSDASVLANDGNATPILSGTSPTTIAISAPAAQSTPATAPASSGGAITITSSTNPNQNNWYNKSTVELNWTTLLNATSVRIGYDKYPSGQPTVVYSASTTHKELTLKDGIWYFHVQENVGGTWSAVSTFELKIDTTPPAPLQIRFPHGSVTNDPRPIALFDTTDALSGMDYYTVSVDGNGTVRLASADVTSNPYAVPVQNPGTSTLTVTAYDNAGNSTTSSAPFTVEGLDAPALDPIAPLYSSDILQISGLTYPNARVDVYLTDNAGNIDTQWTRTSTNGSFRVIWSKNLSVGDYRLTAQTTDDTGAKSFMTAPVTVHVEEEPFALVRNIIFNYIPFAFVVIVLLLIVGYFMGFPLLRRLIMPSGRTPAHSQLHAQFTELHEAVVHEMFAMRHAKTKRQLTDEEERFLEHFEKLLNKVEKTIEKDILK